MLEWIKRWWNRHRHCWHEDGIGYETFQKKGCLEGHTEPVMRYHCCGCAATTVRKMMRLRK